MRTLAAARRSSKLWPAYYCVKDALGQVPGSVGFAKTMRGNRQHQNLDALFQQFADLFRGGATANFSLRHFAVVNFARLFRKCVADILSICNYVIEQLRQFAADIHALLELVFRRHFGLAFNPPRVDMRSMQDFCDLADTADRAIQQRTLLLLFEVSERGEPPLKAVVVATGQIEDN